ncbi:MAG: M28 family peptidase [Candidatus Thorarchaeota archaeon]|nr:M28 family peptidase [Candidatus Thorarchaeota archaeon]
MRRLILTVIICFTLLTSQTGVTAISVAKQNVHTPQVIQSLIANRVYGEDYSEIIFESISKTSFQNYIIKLTENGSRWILSPNTMSDANIAAKNWIAQEMYRVSNGRIEVEILGDYQSVLGRLPGYLPIDAPAFLVGGHFDSVIEGPGANDDGSGVATMLELARVLSQYQWPLDIYFGAWNAEEIGLRGSNEVAEILDDRDVELLVHYNIDMLLVPSPHDATVLMAYPFAAYHNGKYWADLPCAMSKNFGQDMIEPVSESDFPGWTASDHYSFIIQGFERSLFAHESGFNIDGAYHTANDVWDNPNYDYNVAIEGVKSIGASIAFTMARAYNQNTIGERKSVIIPGAQRNYYLVNTNPTTVNVSCRWYGGSATFAIYDPDNILLKEVEYNHGSPWEPTVVLQQYLMSNGIYRIQIYNQGGTSTGFEMSCEYESDIDGNMVSDSEEFWIGQEYFSIDSDSDTISDAEEMILGTSWTNSDSDQDMIPDNWELQYHLNPLDPTDALNDEDGDTLTNLQEYLANSNPFSLDSDQDTIPDLWEVQNGLDPGTDDSQEDPDNDQVSNLREYLEGTNPLVAELRLERYVIPIMSGIGFLLGAAVILWKKKTGYRYTR